MAKKTAWDIVMLARDSQRPKAKDYIENIVDDFIEFHGDRCFGDDKSIIGGIALKVGIPQAHLIKELTNKSINNSNEIKILLIILYLLL